ncbi:MAG: transcriptional regulator [Lachnospiraceae bacterium]|nr:transcriptional regulator [Lachnospiraceae bacterium]
MSEKDELVRLRHKTGMNRREFCEYFGIPYRTVQDWELGSRKMPAYLLPLMEFKIDTLKVRKERPGKEKSAS